MNPSVADAERRAIAWADSFGFCGTEVERAGLLATGSADFYARFAPHADPSLLAVATCWVYWGFAFDDAFCDEGPASTRPAEFAAIAGRVQRCLETPGERDVDDPYLAAIHDLGETFRTVASPVVVQRFIGAHRGWLGGVQWQIANQSMGHMPDVDDYLTMRLHSAGGEPTYELLEIANGMEVPARELYSPRVVAMTEMAILVAALDNDRHSYAKERGRAQVDQNIVNVLRHNGFTIDDAIGEAVGLRDRILCRFLRVRNHISAPSQELRRYLDDLGHGIAGNAAWGQRTARYLSPAGAEAITEAVAVPGHWAQSPADSADAPPPYAESIAWWWEI